MFSAVDEDFILLLPRDAPYGIMLSSCVRLSVSLSVTSHAVRLWKLSLLLILI